jgi:hypothetical protein
MLLKPFVALAFWGVALGIARIIMRCIPAGRIKRLLATPERQRPALGHQVSA